MGYLHFTIWIIFNFSLKHLFFLKYKISYFGNFQQFTNPYIRVVKISFKHLIASPQSALHISILTHPDTTIFIHIAALKNRYFSYLLQYHTDFSQIDFCFSARAWPMLVGGSIWLEKIVTISVTAIPSRKQDFPSDQYYLNC